MTQDIIRKKDSHMEVINNELEQTKEELSTSRSHAVELRLLLDLEKGKNNVQDETISKLEDQNAKLSIEIATLRGKLKELQDHRDGTDEKMNCIIEELEKRTRLHSDLQIKYIDLQRTVAAMENAVLKPFWEKSTK